MFQKQSFEEKHGDLLLIEEEGKRHYVFIKNFNTGTPLKENFCCYCLQALSAE